LSTILRLVFTLFPENYVANGPFFTEKLIFVFFVKLGTPAPCRKLAMWPRLSPFADLRTGTCFLFGRFFNANKTDISRNKFWRYFFEKDS
jgi:hypothetical protein